MTPSGMAAMRVAATLAHALPTVRVRVRAADRTLLEVAHAPTRTGEVVGACGFRRAVAGAHAQTKRGIRIAFMDLPEGADLAIDVGVRPGDATLPGGIYRVRMGEQTVHGFATTLPTRNCRKLLEPLPEGPHVIRLHHDAATEVTFVHTVTPTNLAPADGQHLEPVLEALLADEVADALTATAR